MLKNDPGIKFRMDLNKNNKQKHLQIPQIKGQGIILKNHLPR